MHIGPTKTPAGQVWEPRKRAQQNGRFGRRADADTGISPQLNGSFDEVGVGPAKCVEDRLREVVEIEGVSSAFPACDHKPKHDPLGGAK